jgi:predicted dienelactone hydrolase
MSPNAKGVTLFARRLAAVMLIAWLWTGVALAADLAAPYHVGQVWREFHPGVARNWRGARKQGLTTTIWYPVAPDIRETPHDIGAPGDPIFRGHPVAEHARVSPAHATYPLLMLSHGTGGSAVDLDWLASALAANGYIVAGVNHPGNTALEPLTREGFMLWWERATDVSEALDAILADPALGPHIDRDRIGAVGFSLGGYTLLELAGARTNLQAFRDFCQSSAADAICHPREMNRLKGDDTNRDDFSPEMKASMARAGDSYRDRRIKAVFAIAPALGEAFDSASFADVAIPVSLLAGTDDVTAPVKTNIDRIASLLPSATIMLVPAAAHYTFLDTCLPAVAERLADICVDHPDVDRDKVHEEAVERVMDFFQMALPTGSM